MNHNKPSLLIIPGLGDRVWLYSAVIPLWRALGYDVHVRAFGWNGRLDELQVRQKRLLRYVDTLPVDRLTVIGASAGGVAAINLLCSRPAIRKVVTIASPLLPKEIATKPLLVGALKEMDRLLTHSPELVRQKVLSVHGRVDRRVPVGLSRRPGIRTAALNTAGHGLTIALALTIHGGLLHVFMRSFDVPQESRLL